VLLRALARGIALSTPSLIVLLIMYSLLLTLQNPEAYFNLLDPSRIQQVELEVAVSRSDGRPAVGADVAVLLLSEEGPVEIARGRASLPGGVFRASITVPRILKRPGIYAAVNLMVAVSWKGGEEVGIRVFSIDPTNMLHPRDRHKVTVRMIKVPRSEEALKSAGLSGGQMCLEGPCWLPTGVIDESWRYTQVLEFGTWDNIWAKVDYDSGTKVVVQSKVRYWVVGACRYDDRGWMDSGSTTVTVDTPLFSGERDGRHVHKLKFKFRYVLYRYTPPNQNTVQAEVCYAVDTDSDANYYTWSESSWSGSLPSWSQGFIIYPGDKRRVEVGGSDQYIFSVSVSFSYNLLAQTVTVTVNLGVTKTTTPPAYLYIRAGEAPEGYTKVKVVSPDSSYLKTRSNWVP